MLNNNLKWPIFIADKHLGKRSKISSILKYFSRNSEKKYNVALDIGCGTGALSLRYRKYANRWFYLETDQAAAKIASAVLDSPVETTWDKLENKRFDLIVIVDTFFYFTDPDGIIGKFKKLLSPGGEILIVATNGDNSLILNKLRNFLNLGRKARGFYYEESAIELVRRFSGQGFENIYFKNFSYALEELILLAIDLLQAYSGGLKSKTSDTLTNTRNVGRLKLCLLCLSFPIIKFVSLLDYPMRFSLSGYRFAAVFKEKAIS